MKHETIMELFASYLATVYDTPLPKESQQYKELRRCFFAAFAVALDRIVSVGAESEVAALAALKRWTQEAKGYSHSVRDNDI